MMSIVGVLGEDADPLVSVMKVEKAPSESYADIGGLYEQVRLICSCLHEADCLTTTNLTDTRN